MLEPLGLGVHLVPAQAQRLHQVQLQQPVVAHDLERDPLARRRERGAVITLVAHQAKLVELLQHRGRRGRRDSQLSGQRVGGDLSPRLELPDRLEIVLRRLANHKTSLAETQKLFNREATPQAFVVNNGAWHRYSRLSE